MRAESVAACRSARITPPSPCSSAYGRSGAHPPERFAAHLEGLSIPGTADCQVWGGDARGDSLPEPLPTPLMVQLWWR